MSLEDESDIHAKNNECVLNRQIENEFVVIFITYYPFDVDLMDFLWAYAWNYFVQESSASYVISIRRSHSSRSYKTSHKKRQR